MKLHFIHRWSVIEDNGSVKYTQCKKCFKRKAQILTKETPPLDWDWIRGKNLFLKSFLLEFKRYETKLKLDRYEKKLEGWQDRNLQVLT